MLHVHKHNKELLQAWIKLWRLAQQLTRARGDPCCLLVAEM
jgi:hypothetical protein